MIATSRCDVGSRDGQSRRSRRNCVVGKPRQRRDFLARRKGWQNTLSRVSRNESLSGPSGSEIKLSAITSIVLEFSPNQKPSRVVQKKDVHSLEDSMEPTELVRQPDLAWPAHLGSVPLPRRKVPLGRLETGDPRGGVQLRVDQEIRPMQGYPDVVQLQVDQMSMERQERARLVERSVYRALFAHPKRRRE
jgi:hypothetical protein